MDKQLLSTGKDDWGTPQGFFDNLCKEFNFTLDVCADENNYKIQRYFTQVEDGLSKEWEGETVFCNPPYSKRTKSKPGQADWIKKCYEQHMKYGITVVMLIAARTDTIAFHDYILGKAEVRFLKGRLKFEINRKPNKEAAPLPTMVIIYEKDREARVIGIEEGSVDNG